MKKDYIEMTVKEFKQRLRPDGVGIVAFTDSDGKTEILSAFTEVVCDFCNAEITEKDEKTKEPNKVYLSIPGMSYAICKKCFERIKD
jgi:hypothetical protein